MIFSKLSDDTAENLEAMLEQDLKYGKFEIMIKKEADKRADKGVLLQHYMDIKNVFLHVASTS